MPQRIFLVLFLALCIVAVLPIAALRHELQKSAAKSLASAATCDLCFLAVNEVQGLLAENLSEAEISDILENDICAKLPQLSRPICDGIAALGVPFLIATLDEDLTVAAACQKIGLCSSYIPPQPDFTPVTTVTINLDLPPAQRWDQVCSDPQYLSVAQTVIDRFNALLPTELADALDEIGQNIDTYIPQPFAGEMLSCAYAAGVRAGDIVLLNLMYEVSDLCTAIIVRLPNGEMLQARNLDFGLLGFAEFLRNMTARIEWQTNGQTLYTTAGFVGYVGVLSGVRSGLMSLTLNTRMMGKPMIQMLTILIDSIKEKNYELVGLVGRTVLENATSYASALKYIQTVPLIADVYYIVASGQPNEGGAVITRNQTTAVDSWILPGMNSEGSAWFEVQTNYDHWKPLPWFDDRAVPAEESLSDIGQYSITMAQIAQNVLTVKPVLNQMTTYTAVMAASNGTMSVWNRYCNSPCPV